MGLEDEVALNFVKIKIRFLEGQGASRKGMKKCLPNAATETRVHTNARKEKALMVRVILFSIYY